MKNIAIDLLMTESEKSNLIISGAPLLDGLADEGSEDTVAVDEVELRTAGVTPEHHLNRLDRTLAAIVPEFSRSYLQQLIEAGGVRLNGQLQIKASAKVKAGDVLLIELRPTPQSQAFKPEDIPVDAIFEDEHLLVVHKPAGLVVHPAPGNWTGTLLNGLLARDAAASALPRAGIVHRLDKDTSGLMVVARRRQVMDSLVKMIAQRHVSREYFALAHGAWKGSAVKEVDFPIGRDPRNRLRMAVVDLGKTPGKVAATTISLLSSSQGYCLVNCKLHTGRTHQIRVHMAAIGHPLLADSLYGGAVAGGLARQALHAWKLAFLHPVTGQAMNFEAPVPTDIQRAGAELGLRYNYGS